MRRGLLAIADMIDMRMPFTLRPFARGRRACRGRRSRDGTAGVRHSRPALGGPHARYRRVGGSGLDLDAAGPLGARARRGATSSLSWRARAGFIRREGKPVAALVLRHHERLDGSGYHRYARPPDLSPAARILAAAEAFQTAREARPHRQPSDAAAAAKLRSAVREGKLCADAVEAVLSVAGQPSRRAPPSAPPG